MQPKAVIIGGANGAGKTTFAQNMLAADHPECTFLNADEIQREAPEFAAPAAAGRELIFRLTRQVEAGHSFAIETTLSSRIYARKIPSWRARGFQVWLYFLEVQIPEFAIARVAERVAAGGHGIPRRDIIRRHARSRLLFPTYQQLADAWYHFEIDDEGRRLVAFKEP